MSDPIVDKDFRPRGTIQPSKNRDDLAGTNKPEDAPVGTAREISVFSLDKFEDDLDFRPRRVIEESEPDPKDSSVLESARSSKSTTLRESASGILQTQIASAVKVNTPPKVNTTPGQQHS